MCLIAFAIGASERLPLVIASNRDEFLARPTLPLARWHTPSGTEIISGRDLTAGGTWLGLTPSGRVAFLTNVREAAPAPAALSRGHLVTRWLESKSDFACFADSLEATQGAYGGFNLVIGDLATHYWAWMTNRASGLATGWHVQSLTAGIYGLSNAALDTPWPKTTELKRVLTAALSDGRLDCEASRLPLWTALRDRGRAPIGELPATGLPVQIENALSSAFVDLPQNAYGTRSSSLLVASRGKSGSKVTEIEIQVEERTFLREEPDVPERTGLCAVESFTLETGY